MFCNQIPVKKKKSLKIYITFQRFRPPLVYISLLCILKRKQNKFSKHLFASYRRIWYTDNKYRPYETGRNRIMAYGKISKKQSEILEYIKSQIINKGYPPSVRDICEAVQLKSPRLPFIPIWRLWKRTAISAATPPSPALSKSSMTASIPPAAVRW